MPRDLFGDMAEASIAFLRECEPSEGYYGAFSGGKDSVVVKDLARRAGVAVDWHYHNTCVDPPELVRFIKRQHPDVARERPPKSMWRLIEEKGLPTRRFRFCCTELKERGGRGRRVLTGIRSDESIARRARGPIEQSRRYPDTTFVHPILSWRAGDVWAYIRARGLPYCHLYDEGFKRLCCVICPFERNVPRAMKRWPKLYAAAARALGRRWQARRVNPSTMARFLPGEVTEETTAALTPEALAEGTAAMWEWWLARTLAYPPLTRDCSGLFV